MTNSPSAAPAAPAPIDPPTPTHSAPASDTTNATRGLVASLNPCSIYSSSTERVVWNNDAYKFLQDDCPDTANPSLWRQSRLCAEQGLFKVTDGIYQVRGFDISNITFVETFPTAGSPPGVVVIDPLISYECAQKALELYLSHRPGRVIRALIYTHSHIDHFGGAGAIVDAAPPELPIYAPEGFFEHSVSENIYAGNAMLRRAVYMYGILLEKGPKGQIGTGLGLATSTGKSALIPPTVTISTTGQSAVIDGLKIVFQVTPGTEAPSEMNFFFPQYKALCMAENASHTMHNIQTLRGALVRDARLWSYYLDESIVLYGHDSDVVFSSHHWPTWGNDNIITFLSQQRDLYAYLHNETLRQLNNGLTGLEIAEDFKLPPSLDKLWATKGYYGSISHNVKAIYNRYMGWFDGNPAHLWQHPPAEEAKRYVDCLGGIDRAISLGLQYEKDGDLRFAATLLSHAVFADQENKAAREALQSVLTKLGYAAENATWRNFFLTGARELTHPIQANVNAVSPEALLSLSIQQLLDSLVIRINGPKAWNKAFTIDIMISDLNSGWHLNLSNGALTGHAIPFKKFDSSDKLPASLTIEVTHRQLVGLTLGQPDNLDGIHTSGDVTVWKTLLSLLTIPDTSFAIVTPEKVST
ncbi:DEKNAAC103795 [Brettanomyces naardenensis]|uniref:DEKNAAC103795 n=1 Tax=Brettanomyces naardenensis TaxID=13370 RepID=A0A448YP68_BRENA|nr:DEKNAAC103795 [Brettanomyces naardenensis]